jgi:hypothetical protein
VGVALNFESVAPDDEFTVFLFIVATHPAASISPIVITKANGTIRFITGSGTGRMILIQ